MTLSFLELQDTYARVLFEDTKPYIVNAIRRTMLTDLPKLSIEDVTIYDNTSALFDEIIAHRLGLVPLPMHQDILNPRNTCACKGEGCPSCVVRYTLSKDGECTVYSGDLRPEDSMWSVIDKKIPIVKLLKNQRLILEAAAQLGKGSDHAKWQTVCGIGYKYHPVIKINGQACNMCGSCVKACPRKILEIKREKLTVKDIKNCIMCGTCMETCKKEAINVTGDETRIILQYETDGSMNAKDTLRETLALLAKKYEDLGKAL